MPAEFADQVERFGAFVPHTGTSREKLLNVGAFECQITVRASCKRAK
jgi:hypothetical protein